MFKKIVGKAWKYGKAAVIPAAGALASAATAGYLGPKAAAVAAAVTALWGVFSRRPQDEHPSEQQ